MFCLFYNKIRYVEPQVHVVDGSSQQPELEFEAVRLELELFSPEIADKPFVVAFNKMDLPEARENWPSFKKSLQARGIEPFCMSAVQRDGTHEVICAANRLLQERKGSTEEFDGINFILLFFGESSKVCNRSFIYSLSYKY